jgi:hypothetical protein
MTTPNQPIAFPVDDRVAYTAVLVKSFPNLSMLSNGAVMVKFTAEMHS